MVDNPAPKDLSSSTISVTSRKNAGTFSNTVFLPTVDKDLKTTIFQVLRDEYKLGIVKRDDDLLK